jgi:hypothetical protein
MKPNPAAAVDAPITFSSSILLNWRRTTAATFGKVCHSRCGLEFVKVY